MVILGIYGAYGWDPHSDYPSNEIDLWAHGASATLIVDGELKGSIAEERLTRKKYTGSYPKNSVDSLLKSNGLTPEDVDHVCYTCGPCIFFYVYKYNDHVKKILNEYYPNAECTWVLHHIAHAYATFYSSGYDEANVLTLDGLGSVINDGFKMMKDENGSFSTFFKDNMIRILCINI